MRVDARFRALYLVRNFTKYTNPKYKHMKNTLIPLLFIAATSLSASAAVIQTVAGPDVATGGGAGNTLIDTSSDTGDWITSLSNGGTMYIGFDFTVDNNAGEGGGGGFFAGLGFYNGGAERALVGNAWTGLNYGIAGPIGANASSTAYAVGTTVHLVAKLTVVDGGTANDTIELFINQLTEGSADASVTGTLDDFTSLTHRAGNGAGQTTLSNLVVADDYLSAAAVPEPSSSALLSLGGLALILRRRK